MRTAVIGYSGAGKSTLAKRLGERDSCPVLHFDRIGWTEGWVQRDKEEGKALTARFLDENDAWIVDGNWGVFDNGRRFDEADWIIFLDYPRRVCLKQALGRYRENKGKTRVDMAAGCNEKFDFEFFRWIMFKGRAKRPKQYYRRVREAHPDRFLAARSREELDRILERLP